jgi:hypothetical protein
MNETTKSGKGWRILRRILIGLAIFATLIAIFYTEENWRGKRAWEQCKRELEAKGMVLDWDKFIPPPVPDDQNFFKAPKMTEWFVTLHTPGSPASIASNKTNELGQHLDSKYPFDRASRNGSNGPVIVAELFFASPAGAKTGLRFGDPAASAPIHGLIEGILGQSAKGAQGLILTARALNQIKPEQIRLQASRIPSAGEIATFLDIADVVPNLGPLRVEAGADNKSFRVLLVPRPSISALEYLAWCDQAEADFDLIREALQRPYARMEGDYSQPFSQPIPNFVMVRNLAQTLAQRTQCHLLLGQPEKAMREATLLNDSRHMLESAPTGTPMLLINAMIDVAVAGVYVNTIADGLQTRAWQEPQLAALQEQLKQIDLPAMVAKSFSSERAAACRFMETTSPGKMAELSGTMKNSLWQKLNNSTFWFYTLAPRGWFYQNMITLAALEQNAIDTINTAGQIISPQQSAEMYIKVEKLASGSLFSPYSFFAAIAVPNFIKAWQTTARNQTLVNEAQIVCALERYRLAHGEYPETLESLVPQFIEKLPHDIIGGPPSPGSGAASQPLHYRREANGKFLLYSVGWNETDDGGQVSEDREKGDWVWQYPLK